MAFKYLQNTLQMQSIQVSCALENAIDDKMSAYLLKKLIVLLVRSKEVYK